VLPQEVIRAKRDGRALTDEEIDFFVAGITDGSIGEGQAAAFAMAVLWRGMTRVETIALTRAMVASGIVLDWSQADLPGPVLDKHSAGGVGDKVSLVLAPMVAACGGAIPMISGRGLGHTGGTLDKLEAIPGYHIAPDQTLLERVVREAGCAIVGPTADLAPADRRLYAIRDVTATVESRPLIAASILSKKLAAGLDGLVMDVTFGSGALMGTLAEARGLAQDIVDVATGAGCPATALLTDMNEVRGTSAGNAVEVREAIAYLRGEAREPRLHAVSMALAADLLVTGGLSPDIATAMSALDTSLTSGAAAERFARMVAGLGGPPDLIERPDHYLPLPEVSLRVTPARSGFVTAVDARSVGLAIVTLGGGRTRADQAVDHTVGITDVVPVSGEVDQDRPVCTVHARTADAARIAAEQIRAAITVADTAPVEQPIVVERITRASGD